MTAIAVDRAISTARRLDAAEESHRRSEYRRLLGVLSTGDQLTDDDARLMSQVMKELSLDRDDIEHDIQAVEEVAGAQQAVRQAQEAAAQHPPLNELQDRLAAVVNDIAPKIEKLLVKKREVESQIAERFSAQEFLKHEKARLRAIERSRPHAFG